MRDDRLDEFLTLVLIGTLSSWLRINTAFLTNKELARVFLNNYTMVSFLRFLQKPRSRMRGIGLLLNRDQYQRLNIISLINGLAFGNFSYRLIRETKNERSCLLYHVSITTVVGRRSTVCLFFFSNQPIS